MSGAGSITLPWGDGDTTFCLLIKHLRELEEKRKAGSFEIWLRLSGTSFLIDDVIEVLRLGLIGAGVQPMLALGLVTKYVLPGTLLPNALVASRVLREAVVGPETDAVGKWMADMLLLSAAPGSQISSEPAPQWDGARETSINAHSGNSQPR